MIRKTRKPVEATDGGKPCFENAADSMKAHLGCVVMVKLSFIVFAVK